MPVSTRSCAVTFAMMTFAVARTAAAQGGGGRSPAGEEVRATEMARREAILARDTVALAKMVGAEFLEISRRGPLRTRAENLREIATGELALSEIRYDSLTVRVYGDVAVLMGIADNVGTYRGMPFSGKIRYTRVFVRREGRWQAVVMQQTPIG